MSTKRHIQLLKGILCLFVALSFWGMLVPVASASKDTMSCCVGKAAAHCDSGIPAKKVPLPPSEPMCGLDNSKSADDAITIVAEPSHEQSHTSNAAQSTSAGKPCQMECGTCAASSSRQQRRERGILPPGTYHNPSLVIHSRFENQPVYFLSNENGDRTSPRGPPTQLL